MMICIDLGLIIEDHGGKELLTLWLAGKGWGQGQDKLFKGILPVTHLSQPSPTSS